MKAVRIHQRGSADQLVYEDAPQPELEAGDALVRVYASGITKTEFAWSETYEHCDGSPRLPSIPGHELSGVVEQAAEGAEIAVGQEVYGLTSFCRDGCAAEYVATAAAYLAPKPAKLDHITAASVPLAGLTAWQALFHHANLQPGQRVLIHGGAGGVGTYAVQLARWREAHVIATASRANFDFLRQLGADELIDYASERFEDKAQDLDVVFDAVGGETLERSWPLVRPGGTLVTIVSDVPAEKSAHYGIRGIFFIVTPSRSQLVKLGKLIDHGVIKPVIQSVFPLNEAARAFAQGLGGHNRGKIVLAVNMTEPVAKAA